jgi:hypothetical protein
MELHHRAQSVKLFLRLRLRGLYPQRSRELGRGTGSTSRGLSRRKDQRRSTLQAHAGE